MAPETTYDVFLSHSSQDKPAVEELARRLKRRKLKPFLDKWHLVPGEPWQEALEEALDQSQTFAVFLGPGGIGPWQNEEMRDALDIRVRDKSRRVIPVLLPGAPLPEERALPRFLRRLTWVDFRRGLKNPEAFHRLVCGIKSLPPGAGQAGSETAPPASRPMMIAVPHRNPFFTGREALLYHLHQQLQTQGISALAQAAIHGLGGVGKTQTALEYAHRFGQHYQFVLWAVAESGPAIRTAYLSIARELGLVGVQADFESAILAVKAWLSREDRWLFVFDNADDPALLRPYLPSARTGGKVLLTSRAKSFAKVGIREPFRVETLEHEDAVKFLIERTGNTDSEAAAELATELGYLPLALEQAAAYIETVGGSFADYLTRYRRQGVALFAKSKPSTDYPDTVATTWTLSFAAVREASPASVELLTAAAFLVPDSIPIEIFIRGGSAFGGLLAQKLEGADEERLVFWELLEPLERYSLAERLSADAFKLHRLTQAVIKDALGAEGRRESATRVVRALNAAYPEVEFKTWKLCERLQPHARPASEFTREQKLQCTEAGGLFRRAGYFALERGDHTCAKLFTKLSLEICEHALGSEHPVTLSARSNLAETLYALGDLADARRLGEQILESRKGVLGSEHPDTLTSRNILAGILYALGDFTGARDLQQQTLEIEERVLGKEHPETLSARNNLAATLRALGDLADARKLHEQTLEIRERVLGSEHPDTLQSSNNLAETLRALGDLAGAMKLHKQTLQIRERVLGDEHPCTLQSRNNLGLTLWGLGDRAGARTLHEQNLEISERVLGAEHPDTLQSRNNLAATLGVFGDLAGARKLLEKNLEIRMRVLGAEHPDTTMSIWNLLWTVLLLNDSVAAADLIGKLQWLLDCAEDSIPSALQRTIRRRLLDLLTFPDPRHSALPINPPSSPSN